MFDFDEDRDVWGDPSLGAGIMSFETTDDVFDGRVDDDEDDDEICSSCGEALDICICDEVDDADPATTDGEEWSVSESTDEDSICPECDGTGEVESEDDDDEGDEGYSECPTCFGTGYVSGPSSNE